MSLSIGWIKDVGAVGSGVESEVGRSRALILRRCASRVYALDARRYFKARERLVTTLSKSARIHRGVLEDCQSRLWCALDNGCHKSACVSPVRNKPVRRHSDRASRTETEVPHIPTEGLPYPASEYKVREGNMKVLQSTSDADTVLEAQMLDIDAKAFGQMLIVSLPYLSN